MQRLAWVALVALAACAKDPGGESGAPAAGSPATGTGTGATGTGTGATGTGTGATGTGTGAGTGTGTGITLPNSWPCVTPAAPIGVVDDPSHRKTVPYTVLSGSTPDLTLGALTLGRDRAGSTSIRYVLPVVNNRPTTVCFAKLENIDFLGPSGLVTTEDVDYAHGLMSLASAGVETDACLAPGFTGYFHGIATFDLDEVTGVEFDLDPGTDGFGPHPTAILPSAVSLRPDAVVVEAEHVSGPDAILDDVAPYVLLDAVGNPIYWSYLNTASPAVLSVGDTLEFDDGIGAWEIAGASLCTVFQYEAPAVP